MRALDLVICHGDDLIATLKNRPSIPPVGHVYNLEVAPNRYRKLEVVETTSVLTNKDLRSEDAGTSSENEAVRVEVELH